MRTNDTAIAELLTAPEAPVFLGVDPGRSGGMALVDWRGQWLVVCPMPDSAGTLARALRGWWPNGLELPPTSATLERVNSGVWGRGRSNMKMGAVSAFTFGRNFGRLEGVLEASEIPYRLVMPVTWQTALNCRTGGDKNISKAKALQLWPTCQVTHWNADALLLAEYGRRIEVGL